MTLEFFQYTQGWLWYSQIFQHEVGLNHVHFWKSVNIRSYWSSCRVLKVVDPRLPRARQCQRGCANLFFGQILPKTGCKKEIFNREWGKGACIARTRPDTPLLAIMDSSERASRDILMRKGNKNRVETKRIMMFKEDFFGICHIILKVIAHRINTVSIQ